MNMNIFYLKTTKQIMYIFEYFSKNFKNRFHSIIAIKGYSGKQRITKDKISNGSGIWSKNAR